MSTRRLLPLALALCALSGANPPRFVKRTPVLRLLYHPRMIPYLDSPMFSFEIHRSWQGPESIPGGARYLSKDGRAKISVVFYAEGSPQWKPPEDLRRAMRESGAVEDRHILVQVQISSRAAERAGYTTYLYDPHYLLGAKYEVLFTDVVLIPDPEGVFLAKLETRKTDYPRQLPYFLDVLHSLSLRVPKQRED
jgi:hypothetical protein